MRFVSFVNVQLMCTCVSIRPGITVRPRRSMFTGPAFGSRRTILPLSTTMRVFLTTLPRPSMSVETAIIVASSISLSSPKAVIPREHHRLLELGPARLVLEKNVILSRKLDELRAGNTMSGGSELPHLRPRRSDTVPACRIAAACKAFPAAGATLGAVRRDRSD